MPQKPCQQKWMQGEFFFLVELPKRANARWHDRGFFFFFFMGRGIVQDVHRCEKKKKKKREKKIIQRRMTESVSEREEYCHDGWIMFLNNWHPTMTCLAKAGGVNSSVVRAAPDSKLKYTHTHTHTHTQGGGDSSVVRAPDSWLKGRGFESLLERRENFLLQGRLSVLTLISVSVPPPCYHSST